jgi:AraC-like DNA-binding protein
VRVAGAVDAHRAALARADVLTGVGDEAVGILVGGTGVTGVATGAPIDRRIARLVEELRDPTADRGAAIARTRLSAAHLQALFARDIGIPIRTYGLWRRLLHALARVGPLDLTAAAHAGGFADLAHFSRTCRRMLGYAPSALRANLVTG